MVRTCEKARKHGARKGFEAKLTGKLGIDFLIAKSKLARKNNIHAIEVKSGKNTTHRSLDKFSAKYLDWLDTPYLLWDRDLLIKGGILHLPLYMAPLL